MAKPRPSVRVAAFQDRLMMEVVMLKDDDDDDDDDDAGVDPADDEAGGVD